MEAVYAILKRLGEADIESIVEEAAKIGLPPPVATRTLYKLVEKGRVAVVCDVGLKYRVK
ncbi:MAG: hypothetical protein ABWK05_01490 [Pyrobaculum sp.]